MNNTSPILRLAMLLAALAVLSVLASGCAAQRTFASDSAGVQKDIQEVYGIHKDARSLSTKSIQGKACGFKELALAETELEFAKYEADMGDYLRSRSHLNKAKDYALAAKMKASAWEDGHKCLPPDSDRDGVLDFEDQCPNDPEDRDGFKDKDGCPDKDNDKDGILDVDDQCPDDPEDEDGFEDEDGCPDEDNDKDGIIDTKDKCPLEPEDIDTFEDQDGCPDPDNDKDGLCDPWVAKQHLEEKYKDICKSSDACPLEPESFNGFEDEDGCPEKDTDGDGIIDPKDTCPTEPETFNGFEDEDGCPDQIPAKKYSLIVVTENKIELKQKIFFATGKAKIRRRSYKLLDEVANALLENGSITVTIEGHTDSRGNKNFNRRLSKKRADAVKAYLEEKGVPASRMEAVGYGPDKPIASNKTRRGRDKNRRVEFKIKRKH